MFKLFWGKKLDPRDAHRVDHEPPEPAVEAAPREHAESQDLEERILTAIRTVYDPEIPVNVYDLGLVYRLEVSKDHKVTISMTLTAPACPVAGTLPAEVEKAVSQVSGVSAARVELVWDPPWSAERMSDAAKLQLGLV